MTCFRIFAKSRLSFLCDLWFPIVRGEKYLVFFSLDTTQCAALIALPYLLREDPKNFFDQTLKQPTIRCRGMQMDLDAIDFTAVLKCDSFTVIVEDNELTYTRDFIHAFGIVIALHYVFNLTYATPIQASMVFIQKLILDLSDNYRPPIKVLHLIQKIKNSSKV